ncbi:MAG: glycosyltransferase [Gemmatimonadaceae bacterium]|nr:glycosyltransferase [Gemmatimonadaceae bacterium]
MSRSLLDAELAALKRELSAIIERAERLRSALEDSDDAPPSPQLFDPTVEAPLAEDGDDNTSFLVPVLPFRKELTLRALVFASVAAMAWFWMWWIGEGHGAWSPAAIIVTSLFAWASLLSVYFLFFVSRMTKPNPDLPPPTLRVAMVVTKAPSEPLAIVQKTLRAMLSQDYPYSYDVWLSDEKPDAETLRWCDDRGVKVSTRFGVEDYHQPAWPQRTKCKEGNLAYWYDTVGYDDYDVVAQLDADHVPAPHYLKAIVGPFRDPKVGYVSAPSVCDANEEKGWTVKGRLFREATLHGPVQAGSNDGYAPVCIGSHYAVRTQALREIGGLGPELAEDYTTTLWMQSAGWDGVFSIDAEAHGDGPESLAEMLTQEVQWARSLGTVLVRYAPSKLRTTPLRARIRLGFALFFYPLQGVALALAAVLPTLGVLTHITWGDTSLAAFYGHIWPMSLFGIATTWYLRRQNLLRPVHSKLWSWELMLFQLIRWPWAMAGAFQGMRAGFSQQERSFKVTPKGERGLKPLPARMVLPSLLVGAIPAWAAIATGEPGIAVGLFILTSFQALTYLAAVVIAIAIHVWNNAQVTLDGPIGPVARMRLITGDTVLLTAVFALASITALGARLL